MTFCISSCVGFVKWSCFENTHVKSTLCTRVSRHRGVHSYFNRRRVLMVWGCQKDTLIHLSPFAAYLCDMPRLTLGARLRAIGMLQGSAIQADLANRHTVSSLWTHYQDTGLSHDQPRSGRPRVTSQRQDVYIRSCICAIYRYQTRTASYQWENCAEPRTYTRHPPSQKLYSAIIAASPLSTLTSDEGKHVLSEDLIQIPLSIQIALQDDKRSSSMCHVAT